MVLGYVVAPVVLIWGWMVWSVDQPEPRTIPNLSSLIGFILDSTSALLAVLLIVYARVTGGFPFYDLRLLRVLRFGCLLSLSGLVLAIGGVWHTNSLRWHAPVAAIGTLAFWLVAASGE